MDEVLEGLDYIFYLDDILMASNAKEEHKIHLEEVFKWLQQYSLVLHLEKCVFFASSLEFLGQHMSTQGLCLLGTHMAAIKAHLKPSTKPQLMSFLGMLNFYRRYLQGATSILKPLTDAICGAGGKQAEVVLLRETNAKAVLNAFVAGGCPTMACHPSSLQTGACSSPLPCGVAVAGTTACSTAPPRPSTPRPMGWWRGHTAR